MIRNEQKFVVFRSFFYVKTANNKKFHELFSENEKKFVKKRRYGKCLEAKL